MSSKKVRNGQHAGVWSQAAVEMADLPDGPPNTIPQLSWYSSEEWMLLGYVLTMMNDVTVVAEREEFCDISPAN